MSGRTRVVILVEAVEDRRLQKFSTKIMSWGVGLVLRRSEDKHHYVADEEEVSYTSSGSIRGLKKFSTSNALEGGLARFEDKYHDYEG